MEGILVPKIGSFSSRFYFCPMWILKTYTSRLPYQLERGIHSAHSSPPWCLQRRGLVHAILLESHICRFNCWQPYWNLQNLLNYFKETWFLECYYALPRLPYRLRVLLLITISETQNFVLAFSSYNCWHCTVKLCWHQTSKIGLQQLIITTRDDDSLSQPSVPTSLVWLLYWVAK